MSEQDQKATSVRIELRAVEAARIAAAYKGLNLMDYVSKVLLDVATRDIEEGHQARTQPTKRPRRGD